jgi:carbamoyltransferase
MRIISVHVRHDANLSISENDKIILVLELERIFKKRYFASSNNKAEFKKEWKKAIEIAIEYSGIKNFDIAITNWVVPSRLKILKEIINANEWVKCDHHKAHAALGFYDSDFKNPLILSYDGGGNDGVFNFYNILNNKVNLLKRSLLNIGAAYRLLGSLMPEITNKKEQPRGGHMSLSGKIMGYSALGIVIDEWVNPLINYYKYYQYPVQALYSLSNEIEVDFEEGVQLENTIARNLAASSQNALGKIVLEEINKMLKTDNYDGIVLSGGVALNVINNTLIKENFGLPVHVPNAPNDCGISLGSIFARFPPKIKRQVTYKGLPLLENLPENITKTGRKYNLSEIADLLVNKKAIIGIAMGRSEIGPRALGNRSIICYPDSDEKKEIINKRIKFREWYRPLAPVIKEDKSELFCEKKIHSPYMSFAYPFKKNIQGKFPAVEHLDKTARLQTVNRKQHLWLYELLDEVEKRTGFPILLNTSFNTKGKPLLFDSKEAIKILRDTELTHVIINDLLYSKEDLK